MPADEGPAVFLLEIKSSKRLSLGKPVYSRIVCAKFVPAVSIPSTEVKVKIRREPSYSAEDWIVKMTNDERQRQARISETRPRTGSSQLT